MKKHIFEGIGTAIVTPFCNGEVDYTSLKIILDKQIMAGVNAIIVLGTTGEPCTLNSKEREKVLKFVISYCSGKIKVIVGCGSNNTKTVIINYKRAEQLGADGALIVTPYYNKCTQEGLIKHYEMISDAGNLPIIVYNVPSRTGINICPETLNRLADIKNVCGVKDASGSILQVQEYLCLVRDKIAVYSGDDALNYNYFAMGGMGCISVLSNIMPKATKKIYDLCKGGDYINARELHYKLLPIINKLFIEVNPIPVKFALWHLGLCKNELREPLFVMEEKNSEKLKAEIEKSWCIEDDCM